MQVLFFPNLSYSSDHVSWYKVGIPVFSEDNISWRQKGIGCFGVGLFNYLEGFFKLLSLSVGIMVVFFMGFFFFLTVLISICLKKTFSSSIASKTRP